MKLALFALAALALVGLSATTQLEARPGGGPIGLRDPIPAPIQSGALTNALHAQSVVIGKVKSIEAAPVISATSPSDAFKSVYKVAVVAVEELLMGEKGAKTVRVGFRMAHSPQGKALELSVGEAGCFFLWKHFEEPFFVLQQPSPYSFGGFGSYAGVNLLLKKGAPGYDNEMALLRRSFKALEDPKTALRSKDANERLLTAALLISRYRKAPPMMGFRPLGAPPAPRVSQEAISAEESRLILETLASADLIRTDPKLRISALGLFYELGLTPTDGWRRPASVFEIPDAAKKWLQDNARTYRIKRYVVINTTASAR